MSLKVEVDVPLRTVRREGYASVQLSPQQAELLKIYARSPGRPVKDDLVFDIIWPHYIDANLDTLKVTVSHINRRIGVLNLRLMKSLCFGYFLVDMVDISQATQMRIAEIVRDCRQAAGI